MKLVLEKNQKLWFTSDTHYNHSNICSSTTKWSDSRLTRQFASLEAMNQRLVDNINDVVGENDILIHLGDWSFGGIDSIGEFRDRINCKNIHLVLGNHDHHIQNNKELKDRYYDSESLQILKGDADENFYSEYKYGDYWDNIVRIQDLFKSVSEYLYLDLRIPNSKKEIDKYTIVCLHYPIASWNGMNDGVIHLHGHVHLPNHLRVANGKAMDVGVDGNHLKPISLDEILIIMKDQPIAKLALPVDHHEKRM
jgi:calcineurin-like phosphoesterase family protein